MKTIINFAPTGVIPTKEMTPHVPLSVSEIVEDVLRAYEVGITMTHLHIRDEERGTPSLSATTYGKLIANIRKYAPDLIICASLSARSGDGFAKRIEPLYLEGNEKPDMGSLTLASMNFVSSESINTPQEVQKLAQVMKEQGILPELEVFDLGMINYAKYLIEKKILGEKNYFNIMLGNIASAQHNLSHTGMMINDLPKGSFWSLGGIGQASYVSHLSAIASQSGVRVGLEDNIWFDEKRTKLATNSDLVKRVHELLKISNKEMMSAQELREALL